MRTVGLVSIVSMKRPHQRIPVESELDLPKNEAPLVFTKGKPRRGIQPMWVRGADSIMVGEEPYTHELLADNYRVGGKQSFHLPPVLYAFVYAATNHAKRLGATSSAMGHPPQVIFNDSISSLMFNLLKSLARLFGVNSSSVPLKSLSE